MKLHLIIPALFWSDKTCPEIYHGLPIPSLEALLSKSNTTRYPPDDLTTWLCRLFEIKKQFDWPVASIMQQIESTEYSEINNDNSAKDFWLRADPVHLRVEQNHIKLADNHVFQISKDEAMQFTNAINRHLANDYLTLLPLHPYRWYLRLNKAPEIYTQTLDSAICKNINNLLPTGNDSITWRKIFNEIQMVLYEHPLNQARTIHDQLAINSIWFWGGGFMPQTIRSSYNNIWSNEDFSRALAKISKTPYSRLSENSKWWQSVGNRGSQLIVLDSLLPKEKYKDAYGWRECLLQLEQSWFAPLYIALKNNQINELRISTINENASLDFVIKRNNLWKFWATIKPLSFYAVKQ